MKQKKIITKIIIIILVFLILTGIFYLYSKHKSKQDMEKDIKTQQEVTNQIAAISPELLGLPHDISEYQINYTNQTVVLYDASSYVDANVVELIHEDSKQYIYVNQNMKNFYMLNDGLLYYFNLETNKLIYSLKNDQFVVLYNTTNLDDDVYGKLYDKVLTAFMDKTTYQADHNDYRLVYNHQDSIYNVIALYKNESLGTCKIDIDEKESMRCRYHVES